MDYTVMKKALASFERMEAAPTPLGPCTSDERTQRMTKAVKAEGKAWIGCLRGAAVWASDFRSSGHGFDSRPGRSQDT